MNSSSNNRTVTQVTCVPKSVDNMDVKNEICSARIKFFEGVDTVDNQKSFVQQSIERLYGPGSLSLGFKQRRSFSPQTKTESNETTDRISKTPNPISYKALPSVFKHLRPEFRHQLPFRNGNDQLNQTTISTNRPATDTANIQSVKCQAVEGPVVRYIPITIEADTKEDSTKATETTAINQISDVKADTIKPQCEIKKVVQVHSLESSKPILNGSTTVVGSLSKLNIQPQTPIVNGNTEEHDGTYFLKIVDVEVSHLTKEAEKIEKDFESIESQVTEDVKGTIFAAIGKIRLLISQKIKQFKGLCDKNLKNDPSEEFPTTNDDLAGFWDMVLLQVEEVKNIISEINKLRENNWIEPQIQKPEKVHRTQAPAKTKIVKKRTPEEAAKAEARKKAIEDRRKAMREAMIAKRKAAQNNNESNNVEIFIPKDS